MSEKCARLSVLALGLALGLAWGLGMLIMGLLAMWIGFGEAFVTLLGSVYIGYAATLTGSMLGGLWGLVDGFVFGVVIAFIYNAVSHCGCCK